MQVDVFLRYYCYLSVKSFFTKTNLLVVKKIQVAIENPIINLKSCLLNLFETIGIIESCKEKEKNKCDK